MAGQREASASVRVDGVVQWICSAAYSIRLGNTLTVLNAVANSSLSHTLHAVSQERKEVMVYKLHTQ